MTKQPLGYRSLIKAELQQVDALLLGVPGNIPPVIVRALHALIRSGGKRLRPALVILAAHLCQADLDRALPAAAAIEMLHTATLVHDDLIDNALVRRGIETLNVRWTPVMTVLAGDLAFAWAAELVARVEHTYLSRRFAETLVTICEGELHQMLRGQGCIPTREEYEQRIFAKTASLFMLTTEIGAALSGCDQDRVAEMAQFGRALGMAFQIADDVLDIMGTEAQLGKPVGSDLRQGLVTLPVLYYLEAHPGDHCLSALLAEPDDALISALIADLRRSTAPERAMQAAEAHIAAALAILAPYPPSPYRDALEEIAAFAVRRRY